MNKPISSLIINQNKVVVVDHYNHPRFTKLKSWRKPLNYLIYLLCRNQRTFPLEGFVFQQMFPEFKNSGVESVIKEVLKQKPDCEIIINITYL